MRETPRPFPGDFTVEKWTALPVVPAVAVFRMNLGMAGFAKSHQVLSIVRAALGEGLHMVYLLGWCVDTVLKAPLTKRVGSSIAVTDTFPCTSVATLAFGSRSYFS